MTLSISWALWKTKGNSKIILSSDPGTPIFTKMPVYIYQDTSILQNSLWGKKYVKARDQKHLSIYYFSAIKQLCGLRQAA